MSLSRPVTRRRLVAIGASLASAALLAGCGFKLRGVGSLPALPPLSLEGDTTSALARALEAQLSRQGTQVADDAPWRVTLGTPTVENRAIGSEGRASREHELTMSVTVSVQQRANDAYALNNEAIATSTRIRVNNDDLLNRQSLLEEATQALARRLAERIIERLGRLEAPA